MSVLGEKGVLSDPYDTLRYEVADCSLHFHSSNEKKKEKKNFDLEGGACTVTCRTL